MEPQPCSHAAALCERAVDISTAEADLTLLSLGSACMALALRPHQRHGAVLARRTFQPVYWQRCSGAAWWVWAGGFPPMTTELPLLSLCGRVLVEYRRLVWLWVGMCSGPHARHGANVCGTIAFLRGTLAGVEVMGGG